MDSSWHASTGSRAEAGKHIAYRLGLLLLAYQRAMPVTTRFQHVCAIASRIAGQECLRAGRQMFHLARDYRSVAFHTE
ncbi:hypothetical protein DGI_3010 [Megalodesulfovibrio gigas DSM 1382 = ATCC 19364]|uniref:Uncharacterized protein n=1 Tax=Megalodesulfovibrio gigas (strain ATCC 19364 / DSM 1382 / NCIMB 9332 / VKM B-1759) TaxID=1121448 RepID=T2GFN5_MEGG1|nr:hypothetical protein DGI_3010 [Megalodesulfovibrio gigas DSM 1382 = ATCC 19364]